MRRGDVSSCRGSEGEAKLRTRSCSFALRPKSQDPHSPEKFLTRDLATLQTGQDVVPVLGQPQCEPTNHGPGVCSEGPPRP